MTAPKIAVSTHDRGHRQNGGHYQNNHDVLHRDDDVCYRQDGLCQRSTRHRNRTRLHLSPRMSVPSFSPCSSSSSCSSPRAPRSNHRHHHHHHHHTSSDVSSSQLFDIMNHGLWDRAIEHLVSHPTDARIWIISRFASGEVKWKNLPLHLACTVGNHDLATAPSSFSPSLRLIQTLIEAYPRATMHRNLEGNLPIHLACDTISFIRYSLEAEGILSALIHAFPHSLTVQDSRGMRPADILESRGVRVQDGRWGGTILRYIKQKTGELMTDQSIVFDLKISESGGSSCEEEEDTHERFTEDAVETHVTFENDKQRNANKKGMARTFAQGMHAWRDAVSISSNDRRIYPDTMEEQRTTESDIFVSRDVTEGRHDISTLRTDIQNTPSLVTNPTSKFSSPTHLLQADHSSSNAQFCNPISIMSPAHFDDITSTPQTESLNQTISSTAYPFHNFEQELHSMKVAHISMAELLSAKISDEKELRARLAKLEQVHTKLETEYHSLKNSHSKALEKLKQIDRLMDIKNRELQVMRTKENAVSSELSLRLRKEEEQANEINSMRKMLDEEREARCFMEKELQDQKILSSKLKHANEHIAHSNSELAKQLSAVRTKKQSLIQDATTLKEELATKDKQLNEAKIKETSLCEQLMVKLSLIATLEKKSQETQTLLTDEEAKCRELERELLVLRERSANDASRRAEKENIVLEEALVKAGRDQDDRMNLKEREWGHDLYIDKARGDKSEWSILSSNESIDLLVPVIDDALNIQQEIIDRAWELLRKTNFTRRLIEHIPRRSSSILSFKPTLQMLEGIIKTHIKMIGDFDDAISSEELCQSKLSAISGKIFDPSSSHDAPCDFNSDTVLASLKSEALCWKQYTKLRVATRNHAVKIETLHKVASELRPLTSGNIDKNQLDGKHLSVTNEITSIFQRAMSNLLQDTKHIVALMDDTVTVANEDLGNMEKQTACAY